MNCLILSGGNPPSYNLLKKYLNEAELIIGVDGAADVFNNLNIIPDVLIGDFDTADPKSVQALEEKGAQIIKLQAEKNETDTEAALDYALSEGASEIVILGALGGRADHMLSNIMMLVRADMAGAECRIVEENCELIVSDKDLLLSGIPGQTISILPLTAEVYINASGLKYPLDNLHLRWGSSRGISNIMLQDTAGISISGGYALIVKNI